MSLRRLLAPFRTVPRASGPRLCVLHAGMPKTGSSALQSFLAENASRLAGAGILYPRAGRPATASVGHNDLMRAIAGRPIMPGTERLPAALDAEIRRIPHEVLLISAEFLFGQLYFVPDTRIRDFLAARGYRLHVVTYLRDQPEQINSAYAQMTRTLRESCGFRAYLAERLRPSASGGGRPLRLGRITVSGLGPWARHEFRPYDAALRRRGIEPDFLDALAAAMAEAGSGPRLDAAFRDRLRPVLRNNESCGPLQVDVSRRLAALLRRDLERREWLPAITGSEQIIGQHLAERPEAGTVYTALTPRRYRRIREVFAAENAVFARAVWGRDWEEVFPARDPAALVSNDPDDTGDPALRAASDAALEALRPEVEAHIAKRLARLRA